jgi:hypothetical protein
MPQKQNKTNNTSAVGIRIHSFKFEQKQNSPEQPAMIALITPMFCMKNG